MNREIKFRIWDNSGKEYLSLQDYQELGAIEVENDGTLTLSPRFRFLTSMMIIPERFVPQQYTGLKDKNGVEVYEGDIVRLIYDNIEHIYQIIFDKEEFDFKATNGEENYGGDFQYLGCCEEIEVIGNIYENEVGE